MNNYKENDNTMITRQELLELAEIHNTNCVSIFIPTHRAGEETLKGKDALNLKNQLKEIKLKLELQGMNAGEIDTYVKPIQDLIDNGDFWRHQSDGLAIFLADEVFRKYTIPVYFEAFNYLSSEFYLKPIIPLFNGDGLFYLLTLKKDEVHFFEGTRHSITAIQVDDLVPARLEDRVGYDFEQNSLQFRTQQGMKGKGSFHGQQDNDSTDKIELMQYFRAVDKGLMKLIHEEQHPPLVICSPDYYFPIYKEVNSYKTLFPQHISGNPSDKDIFLIHEEAWELLNGHFAKTQQEKLDEFTEAYGTEKASSDIEAILPAVFEGKVDTLFLENRADVFGVYNPATGKTKIAENYKYPNVSLLNLLAMMVLKTRGSVYLIDKEKMPVKSSKVNALFRY